MLRKCVWCSSHLVVLILSNRDFIPFSKGSLDSWGGGGGHGLALNTYQREKSRTTFALEKCIWHPTEGVKRSFKSEIESIMQPQTAARGAATEIWAKLVSLL